MRDPINPISADRRVAADIRGAGATEPLPEAFEADLRHLDGMLHDLAAEDARPPLGLTDRLMSATRPLLPEGPRPESRRAGRSASAAARGDGGGSSVIAVILGQAVWGRLAAAACVMLALLVATQFWRGERAMPTAGPVEADVVLIGSTEWLSEAPEDELVAEVSPFLESGSLGSLDELTTELESMIAGLEM